MLPVVALVGRPNVGKSTLFNVLTRSRAALVANMPGLTRDRQYGVCRLLDRPFVVVDTGGVADEQVGIDALTGAQVGAAIDEADVLVLVVDARDGLVAGDHALLQRLRRTAKPLLLAVNKTDGLDESNVRAEIARLGFDEPLLMAASHGRGTGRLVEAVGALLPAAVQDEGEEDGTSGVRVAIVGRPNVGKSTLVNRLLGEDRVVVSETPGTTRDAIHVPMERDGRRYTLIDTAGVRRRGRIDDKVEKFSVIKTLQAIEEANVVIVLLDASEGVSDQDAALIGMVMDAGRGLVIGANKWDGLDAYARQECMRSLERRLDFVPFARQVTVSALHGSGIGELMKAVNKAWESASYEFSPAELNRALEIAVGSYQPPLVRGYAPRMKYAHPGGSNPPTIVIHGSRTKHLADSYRRYLENFFRKRYKLEGTPVRLVFRDGANPYADKGFTPREPRRRKKH